MSVPQKTLAAMLARLLRRTVLRLCLLLTLPGDESAPRTFAFRFGIPLVLKVTPRAVSTEADALRFLNRAQPGLPIPRLVAALECDGSTYTLMTKLPGRRLLDRWADPKTGTGVDVGGVVADVGAVLEQLWAIRPPPPPLGDTGGEVMRSASGHGLPHPRTLREALGGPYGSTLECYGSMMDGAVESLSRETRAALAGDVVVWVHTDLRMQNVLVGEDGRVTGVVDWEDSGWLPRHWQLHVLRRAQMGCMGAWVRYWRDEYRCEDVTEKAYAASLGDGVLVYPL